MVFTDNIPDHTSGFQIRAVMTVVHFALSEEESRKGEEDQGDVFHFDED